MGEMTAKEFVLLYAPSPLGTCMQQGVTREAIRTVNYVHINCTVSEHKPPSLQLHHPKLKQK